MTLSGLLIFCAAYFVAAASPGPGIAALMARVLAHGSQGILAFIAGFVMGDLVWFTIAATGLAFLAQTFAVVFTLIKYAGAGFLLYLAYKIWKSPTHAHDIQPAEFQENSGQLFLGGLALTLGNPKVILFFIALLPTVIDLTQLTVMDFTKIVLVICIGLSTILTLYVWAAIRIRQAFSNARALKWINKGTSAIMAGAAVAVVTR